MLQEVELQTQATALIEAYREAYFQRYGAQPIIPFISNATDDLRALLREVDYERLKRLIQYYVKMDGDNGWFAKKGHPLDWFKRGIAEVQASLPPPPKPHQDVPIVFWSRCPLCNKDFEIIAMNATEMSEDAHTKACRECGSGYYPGIVPRGTEIPDTDEKNTKPRSQGVMSLPSIGGKGTLEGW